MLAYTIKLLIYPILKLNRNQTVIGDQYYVNCHVNALMQDSELLARAEHRGSALSSKSQAWDRAPACI